MPSKIRPDDWDRLFAPTAPRRGGPLRALGITLAAMVVLALLGVGGVFTINLRQQRFAQAVATATSAAATAIPQRTAAALAEQNATATLVAARAATATAEQQPTALTASVANGGNVREAPVDGTPLDQVRVGEVVQLLEKNADGTWFKITYTRAGQAPIVGWISKTLLAIDPTVEQQVP